jgi:hypothetical protein
MPHRSPPSRAVLLLAATVLVVAAPGNGDAAVRVCKPLTTGAIVEAASELEARRGAMLSWIKLAEAHGPGFVRFQLAWDRQSVCTRAETGSFRCQTAGRPCTISHVPREDLPRLPRGADNAVLVNPPADERN